MIISPYVTSLNASTFTKIELPSVVYPTNIGWYTEAAGVSVGYIIATDSAGTDAANVIADLPIEMKITPSKTDGTIFYAKSLSGTPNLVVFTGLR